MPLGEARLTLAAALDLSMDAVVLTAADWSTLYLNTEAERIFHCTACDVIGESFDRLVPGISAFVNGSHPREAPSKQQFSQDGVVGRRADGQEFVAHVTVVPVHNRDESGFAVVLREASHQRRIQESLARLSSICAMTADAVYVVNAKGFIEDVNPAFTTITGFSRQEAIGQRPALFKSGEHDPGFYERFWKALLAGEVFRGVLADKRRDGQLIYLEQTITPIKIDAGPPTHYVAVARDVTERVRSGAALRRLTDALERQAKEIAQALHDEAGQLLTSAHITLSQLKHAMPDSALPPCEELKRNLDSIEEELRRVAHELRPRILDDLGLIPAVEFLADSIRQRAGIPVIVQSTLSGRLPALLETAIYRFVQETVSNARRHGSPSRVVIKLERCSGAVYCSVTDDGIGFEPRTVAMRGSLGLFGIRERIEALGGTVSIDSAPMKGTAAVATIPVGS